MREFIAGVVAPIEFKAPDFRANAPLSNVSGRTIARRSAHRRVATANHSF
jgi:hypothetical protein